MHSLKIENKGSVLRVSAIIIFLMIVVSIPGAGAAGDEDVEVLLRFSPSEGKVLVYKGTTTGEFNWHGIQFTTVHTDLTEMTLLDRLEDGNVRMAVKYVECSDKRSMGGGALEDFDSPIKAKGRTIKVVVNPKGEVEEAAGFILGVKKGKALDEYIGKWFFDLPEEKVKKGSTWTVEYPLEDEDDEEGEGENENKTDIRGTVYYTLKKFEKKDGIQLAVIEQKSELDLHTVNPQGTIDGRLKTEGEVKIAVEGGYIFESKSSFEMKGELVSQDEVSGKETKSDVLQIRHTEIKLEK